MPQLHETILGRTFFEGHMPRLIKSLGEISSAMQEANEIAVRHNLIMIEANELKKRELDMIERHYEAGEVYGNESGEILE